MARRCGGRVAATASAVIPPYDTPHIPTLPSHQGWRATHSTAS